MIGWLRRLFARRPDPAFAAARFDPAAVCDAVQFAGEASGRPRGLRWVAVEPAGDPVFAWDRHQLVALLTVVIRFEPIPGSDMEEVEAARLPRPAVAVCRYADGWRPDPKPLFNLSVPQVLDRSDGRLRAVPFR